MTLSTPGPDADSIRKRVIARLRELISALVRRQPQIERAGEQRIARESATLKREAQDRIAELEASGSRAVAAP